MRFFKCATALIILGWHCSDLNHLNGAFCGCKGSQPHPQSHEWVFEIHKCPASGAAPTLYPTHANRCLKFSFLASTMWGLSLKFGFFRITKLNFNIVQHCTQKFKLSSLSGFIAYSEFIHTYVYVSRRSFV